ncbi:unnamed protein product [Prunus armeniaca]
MLREGNIGVAKPALEKNGFALPKYSNFAQVAYVLQVIVDAKKWFGTFGLNLVMSGPSECSEPRWSVIL